MQILALIPLIVAGIVAFGRSPERAFLNVYLPVLLFLPDYYRWSAPGLPDPSFSQSAILPVAFAAILRYGSRWRFTFTDFLVFGFAFSIGYSELVNAGYSEAQNLMFDVLAWIVLPYAATKLLVEPLGLSTEFGRRIVQCLFLLSIISVFEFRFGMTPFRIVLDRFFPGQGLGWVTTFRWGFARVAGPYGHAILAGIIFLAAYRVHRWLEWSNSWEPTFKWLPGVSKSRVITATLIAGVIMTMVRGPWIGGFLGAGIAMIGRAKNRRKAAMIAAIAICAIGIPAGAVLFSYASVGRANATTVAQESAAYRKELIDKYVDIAMERSLLGWGRNTWPKVDGMPSIDNYYLLLALMHGVTAVVFMLAIFLYMMGRLGARGLRGDPAAGPRGSSLEFTLLSVYALIAFSIATVYMGGQVMPLFAIVTGWSEGLLLSAPKTTTERATASSPVPTFRFERVVI